MENNKKQMPVLFIGHGSPMNAIENNNITKEWQNIASLLPQPKAILCISAHWETGGTKITAMEHPKTIHDFYGFPKQLFDVLYPAKGSSEIAKEIMHLSKNEKIDLDYNWGLDHGTWSILNHLYPEADIPVLQLSIDDKKSPLEHFQFASTLKLLRNEGILILGSGNIVHNLGEVEWTDYGLSEKGHTWAIEFDELIKELILKRDFDSIINFEKLGLSAQLSIPTSEHFLPLIYCLGMTDENDKINFFTESLIGGSLSMRSVVFGSI